MRWNLAVIIAILTGLLVLAFLIITLIPQLVQSVALFSQNFDNYSEALIRLIENSPLRTKPTHREYAESFSSL